MLLSRFPNGSKSHSEFAPGFIDRVRMLDAAGDLHGLIDGTKVPRGCTLVANGWTFDPALEAPVGQVVVTLDDRVFITAQFGIEREDICSAYKSEALKLSGFRAIVPTGTLTGGQHVLKLYLVDALNGTHYETPGSFEFEIVPAREQVGVSTRLAADSVQAGIESIVPAPAVACGTTVTVHGRAFERTTGRPCHSLFVAFEERCIRAVYGRPHPEAEQLGAKDPRIGFNAHISTVGLSPGVYRCDVLAVAENRTGYAEIESAFTLDLS